MAQIEHNSLRRKLFRHLGIVFSENVATKAMNFVIILLLSVHLGPGDYGKYSYIFVNVAFCAAFFDFGMENTAVRFSARDKNSTNVLFGLYALAKLTIVGVVTLALALFGEQIFTLLGKPEMVPYLPYFIVGFIGESLLFVNDTYLQAIQRFKLRAMINIGRFLLSLFFVGALYLVDDLKLEYALLLYYLPIAMSLFFLPKYASFLKSYFTARLRKEALAEVLHYEKWMLLVSIPTNTLGRIDFLMIALWVTYDQIGIYNVAFQLSAIVAFLPFVLSKVMLPSLSELTPSRVVSFTRGLAKPTLLISAGMFALIPLARPVINLILGASYQPAITILQFMLVSAIVAFALIPIEQALYSLGRPKYITVGKCVQIVFIVILISLTVPTLGLVWAAVSVAIARLLYGLLLLGMYMSFARTVPAESEAA
ncbi:lipopolysaccharide biosynthesis protein [Cohnella sp. AR92]|uniref:lipopolysaccharide biosynthesis protein n=1 Tax=Cohnella sp. AR92 TaxID=648716 RepID=UPI000F8DCF75|nr:oligosaccharide flippase family protein [Cohnella sp. AR92]RUS42610.1 hypothetical protein ELR57_26545 [Cohnella sp. AR92]